MYLSYNTNGYILHYIPFRDLFKLYILNTLITRILLMSRSWLLEIKLNFSVLFMAEKWGTTEIISSHNLFLSSSKFWHFMITWYSSSISCLHSGQILCSTGIFKCLPFLYWEEYYCWYDFDKTRNCTSVNI
jgi:hypothetical protein